METVAAYDSQQTSRQAGVICDHSAPDGVQRSNTLTESSGTMFVTKPRSDATSPEAMNECGTRVDEKEGNSSVADAHVARVDPDVGSRRSHPALEASRDSVTANLSDVCSEDVAAAQNLHLGQSNAMIRGGEILGSGDGGTCLPNCRLYCFIHWLVHFHVYVFANVREDVSL